MPPPRNFREAVRLQEMALQEAIHGDRDDVLDILLAGISTSSWPASQ